jgi:hypothetical protein
MEATSAKPTIELSAREIKRLVAYLDVLIEMHLEYKRNHKGSKNEQTNEVNDKDEAKILLDF